MGTASLRIDDNWWVRNVIVMIASTIGHLPRSKRRGSAVLATIPKQFMQEGLSMRRARFTVAVLVVLVSLLAVTRASNVRADGGDALPSIAPRSLLACERALGDATTTLVSADLKALAVCSEAQLECLQIAAGSARDACLVKAENRCGAARRRLDDARAKFGPTVATGCAAHVPLPILRAASALGFERLESSCEANAGIALTSLDAIDACVQRAATCRAERALAIAVPRLRNLVGTRFDVEGNDVCGPPPSGDTDGLGNAVEAPLALKCQAKTTDLALKLFRKRLLTSTRCTDALLACRLAGKSKDACGKIAARCNMRLGALQDGDKNAIGRLAEQAVLACGHLDPAALFGPDGLGFAATAARCNAVGIRPVGSPDACLPGIFETTEHSRETCPARLAGTCVGRVFDCAATAVVRDALPFADDEFKRYGFSLTTNPFCAESATWAQDALAPADLMDVALKDVHPMQTVIGYDEIYYKLGRYRLHKDEARGNPNKRFDDWCGDNGQLGARSAQPGATLRDPTSFTCTVPLGSETPDTIYLMKSAIIGPGGQLYLTDGHHSFTAYWEQPDGGPDMHIRVRIQGNLSHLSLPLFWKRMQKENKVWLFDANNRVISPDELPYQLGLASFQDDPFRGLVYFTRDIGYAIPVFPMPAEEFLEFHWGRWLRRRFDLSQFDLTDLTSYLDLVKQASQTMDAVDPARILADNLSAERLGQLPKWNDGSLESSGEFATLSKPLSASKPGKLAYALDYKASLPH